MRYPKLILFLTSIFSMDMGYSEDLGRVSSHGVVDFQLPEEDVEGGEDLYEFDMDQLQAAEDIDAVDNILNDEDAIDAIDADFNVISDDDASMDGRGDEVPGSQDGFTFDTNLASMHTYLGGMLMSVTP